uniref:Ubiquitin-like domain-containing protein n=1 Tax=Cucumis melo TaxID=3656 RepID=A0A9I9E1A9_CUCME
MKKWSSKTRIRSDEYGRKGEDIDWELRPGGMIVQKRRNGSGDLKTVLQRQTGLEPTAQRLLFKGKEKENEEWLHMAGVNDMSKLILMEDPATKERKMEEMKKNNSVAAGEALAEIGVEVDKLSEKVAAVEGGVNGGKRVEEKELNVLIELLMIQLLKLDAIEIHADSKIHRRTQVSSNQSHGRKLQNENESRQRNSKDGGGAATITTVLFRKTNKQRVMQSRQYSQKYRLKQLHYITQLESELKALQAEVTITSPRIKFMDRQNSLLRAENYSIKEKLSAYTGELLFKEAQYEELKRERNMLKEIYEAYQVKLMETLKSCNNNNISAASGSNFQLVENYPQMASKSNPFTMLEN